MAEYTYNDIIMDPEDPRLEGAIGKECYFSDYPKKLLNSAIYNLPEYLDYLTDIRKEGVCTFVDKKGTKWASIIIKKEESKPKPKYVPFENATEFLDAYRNAPGCLNEEDYFLSNHGIWLMDCENGDYFLVTEIWGDGVVLGSNQETTHWDDLLEDFIFLDGSPCGKLMEVKDL